MARLFLEAGETYGPIGSFTTTEVIGTNGNETVIVGANGIGNFDTARALANFGDWTDRVARGELPFAKPARPTGTERNFVVTMWDWADPKAYLHDQVSTDRRNPTVNSNGPIYGALELSADYLPVLDPRNVLAVDEHTGGTLTMADVPGFALEIEPGSVTFPGGARSGQISVTAVHNDKVPMPPNFGQQPRFVITIQPGGAKFEPPARVTFPNVDGLLPGQVTELYSFDHDLARFVSIGPGTVTGDGTRIVAPCAVCHGSAGQGQTMDTPVLAAQKAAYLEQTMLAYKSEARRNDIYRRMRLIVQQLNDEEIRQLARYYAGLER